MVTSRNSVHIRSSHWRSCFDLRLKSGRMFLDQMGGRQATSLNPAQSSESFLLSFLFVWPLGAPCVPKFLEIPYTVLGRAKRSMMDQDTRLLRGKGARGGW